ncbi:MAG TPA: O-antigen ligase family protein [candidate division Zixibacteria bacterium]|nr:O-antigen ligase family protein [candidate division Zixibacteria bacterium]
MTGHELKIDTPTTGFSLPSPIRWLLLIVALAVVGVAGDLLFVEKPLYGFVMLAAVAGAFLIPFPRVAFFVFLTSITFYLPTRLGSLFALHPFDLLMAVLFMGMVLDFFLHGYTEIRSAFFDTPFIIFIIATIISALFAYNIDYSIVPMVRVIVIYLAFRAVFKFSQEFGVRKVLLFYIYVVFAHSIYNTILFILSGGHDRVFGFCSLGYEPMSMTALPMALVFLIWSDRTRDQIKFGTIAFIIGTGIISTQSRAPLLAVLMTLPVLVYFGIKKARRENTSQPLRTMKKIFVPIGILVLIGAIAAGTYLAGALGRYEHFIESFSNPQGTIALRFVLWKTAIRTFLDHPITGIGIGNFRIVYLIYPELKVVPLYVYVQGMSAHNVILHYLAETGLVGSIALLVLAFKGFATCFRAQKEKLDREGNQVSMALFIAMFVFCMTIFYMRAWTWGQDGYIMAMIFGLTAGWVYERRKRENDSTGHKTGPGSSVN